MPEISLTSPVNRPSEAKYKVREFSIYARPGETPFAVIAVSVQDSGDSEIRYFNAVIPDLDHPGATVAGLVAAFGTARSGETGGVLARANYRILGYLLDEGYFPAATLVP